MGDLTKDINGRSNGHSGEAANGGHNGGHSGEAANGGHNGGYNGDAANGYNGGIAANGHASSKDQGED